MLPECLARSMRFRDAEGRALWWDARLLNLAFDEICAEREGQPQMRGQRMLAEHAVEACERCYGVGREIVRGADGYTFARACDHRPDIAG